MRKVTSLIILFTLTISTYTFCNERYELKSPNDKITVTFWLTPAGTAVYSVSYSSSTILEQSKLGIVRSDDDFSTSLTLDSVSNISAVSENYTLLHGKRLNCSYSGNKQVFYLKNVNSKIMEIIFQVSNDGLAFRYYFPEKTDTTLKIYKELTSYHFDLSTKAFLQPCDDARMGWCFASPSYENYYSLDIPVGTISPNEAGWVMPALFHSGKFWISITETAVDTNYCGSRLSQFSPNAEYSIQFPQPQESRDGGPFLPESVLPWYTPWRIIAISDNLGGLVESTLETDLATPAKYDVSSWLQPGIASWSWVILKDSATKYNTQLQYIDFAARMNWKYCLILRKYNFTPVFITNSI